MEIEKKKQIDMLSNIGMQSPLSMQPEYAPSTQFGQEYANHNETQQKQRTDRLADVETEKLSEKETEKDKNKEKDSQSEEIRSAHVEKASENKQPETKDAEEKRRKINIARIAKVKHECKMPLYKLMMGDMCLSSEALKGAFRCVSNSANIMDIIKSPYLLEKHPALKNVTSLSDFHQLTEEEYYDVMCSVVELLKRHIIAFNGINGKNSMVIKNRMFDKMILGEMSEEDFEVELKAVTDRINKVEDSEAPSKKTASAKDDPMLEKYKESRLVAQSLGKATWTSMGEDVYGPEDFREKLLSCEAGVNEELIKRVAEFSDEELKTLIVVVADRNILDKAGDKDGKDTSHVDEDKRRTIVREFTNGETSRARYLRSAEKTGLCTRALHSLLSFQVKEEKDSEKSKGISKDSFVKEALRRTTLIDVKLLEEALAFMEELKQNIK